MQESARRHNERTGQHINSAQLEASVEGRRCKREDAVRKCVEVKGDVVVKLSASPTPQAVEPNTKQTRTETHEPAKEVTKEKIEANALKLKGNEFAQKGKWREAVEQYTAAIALDSDNQLLYMNRSLANLKVEDWQAAEADARKAVALDAQTVKAHFRLGQALCGQARWDEALSTLSHALDLEGLLPAQALEIGTLIATCEEELKGSNSGHAYSKEDVLAAKEAKLPVTVFLKLKPFYDAAYTAMRDSRFRDAMKIYEKILEIYSSDYTSLLGLGSCLLQNKSHRYDKACNILQRLCDFHGKDCLGGWRMLGEAHHGAGRYEQALKAYGQAGEMVEKIENAEERTLRTKDLKVQVSKTLLAQKKTDLALHFISQILKVDDKHVPSLIQYGKIMIERDDDDEALKVALRVVIGMPKDRHAKRFFCKVLSRPGMTKRLLAQLPETMDHSGWSFLAGAAKEYGAIESSIALYRKSHEKEPTLPAHVLSLVHVLEIDSRQKEALEVIKTWLRAMKNFVVTPPKGKI